MLLLPVFILYEKFILLWKLLVFNFDIMPELFALEWVRSVFTMSIWLPSNSSTLSTAFLELLQASLMWFILAHTLDLLPYAGHLWDGCLDPQYMHGLVWPICFSGQFVSTVCVHQASSCFAYIRTCSLGILLAFHIAVSSLFIFICMFSFVP